MVRTQIQFTSEQHSQLRAWAHERGISLSEAVRRCVASRLSRDRNSSTRAEVVAAALAVCGKYSDPAGDSHIADEHDRHLAEAFGQ